MIQNSDAKWTYQRDVSICVWAAMSPVCSGFLLGRFCICWACLSYCVLIPKKYVVLFSTFFLDLMLRHQNPSNTRKFNCSPLTTYQHYPEQL
jgi:hypothetical protein